MDSTKLSLMIIFGAIAYNEFLAYYLSYLTWPSLPTKSSTPDWLRVLLVADPQIQGYCNEGFYGRIRRWDIDRYLTKNYGWAWSKYQPNVVVFLGDLLDEGSIAEDDDYDVYVARFKAIYGLYQDGKCGDDCNAIFVAGDNDIGGEGGDKVTKAKVERFNRNFPSKPKYTFVGKNLTLNIVPVNTLLDKLDDPDVGDFRYANLIDETKSSALNVMVSHIPVLPFLRA